MHDPVCTRVGLAEAVGATGDMISRDFNGRTATQKVMHKSSAQAQV